MNSVNIMGRLTAEPELRRTQSGTAVCRFALAVDRPRAKEEGRQTVDFIDCIAWRHTAEFVQKYFHKGQRMAVSGRLQAQVWSDDEGRRRKTVEVVAESVYFAESFVQKLGVQDPDGGERPYEKAAGADPYDAVFGGEEDGELPF